MNETIASAFLKRASEEQDADALASMLHGKEG
jgi:hypothetical protein